MRTELRLGDRIEELLRELGSQPGQMLVLGLPDAGSLPENFEALLTRSPGWPVLLGLRPRGKTEHGRFLRNPACCPGFGLTLGFTTFFLSAIVLLPLAALVLKTASMSWSDFVDRRPQPARPGVVSADLRRLADRGAHQRGLRLHRGLDARALRVPGPQAARRA